MSEVLPPVKGECQAKHYDRRPCDGPPDFVVRYLSADRTKTLDEHLACFRHGLAEVERHERSGGISFCQMDDAPKA